MGFPFQFIAQRGPFAADLLSTGGFGLQVEGLEL